jgi:ABC-2 type transport system ATP-binding protein
MSEPTNDRLIVVRGVTKRYANGTEALAGVDFDIRRHSIFALVGPNGAGKTTTLRILATQLLPTTGAVSIDGYDLIRQAYKIRMIIAAVPQEASTYPELSAWDHVFYYLVGRGMALGTARKYAERALSELGLWDIRKTPAANLSGGLRHRILITMAIATRAPIMFLDEPTAGLDPIARRDFWNTVAKMKSDTTIIITTHLMEEVESLADDILIINKGRQLGRGTTAQLMSKLTAESKVIFDRCRDRTALTRFGRVTEYVGRLQVYPPSKDKLDAIISWAVEYKYTFAVKDVSLEDAFIYLLENDRE